MPRKRLNLKMQLNKKLDKLLKIGESKHEAKKQYREYCQKNNIKYNPAKTEGIHSIRTADSYRDTINRFGDWTKKNMKDTKHIENINKEQAYKFLKEKEEQGNSPWSVSRDMAALNKCLNLNLNKKDGGLRQRNINNISRSRDTRQHDREVNLSNYKEPILLAKAFGVRRETIQGGEYQAKNINLYKNNGNIYLRAIEKGGKYREVQCLDRYQTEIEKTFKVQEGQSLTKSQFKDLYNKTEEEPYLIGKYTQKIDNHAYRAEYAMERYQELEEQKNKNGENLQKNYKGYDKEILSQVSQDLGHNRLRVVVDHYLE